MVPPLVPDPHGHPRLTTPGGEPGLGRPVPALSGVRGADGRLVDLRIDESGTVDSVRPAAATDGRPAGDWLVLPSAVEPHAHLDKAFGWTAAGAPHGDLPSAIAAWRHHSGMMTEADVTGRARRALARYLAAGITAVRSHVDVLDHARDPLLAVRALLALREQVRDRIDLQLCVLPKPEAATRDIEAALELGVDVLGGVPHLADDPAAETTRLLDLAERRGVPVDLHTDEDLDPHALALLDLARQVRARGLTRRVTASHCVSLGGLGAAALTPVLDEVREAGLSVVTLPITNLYLQGRTSAAPVPRGLTAVRALLAAGITVAAGGDNLRDPFNPMGRGDPFETTSLLVTAAHLDAAQALHAVTDAGRAVLGLPGQGIAPGQPADLILLPAADLVDVLAGAVDDRIVLRRGRVVATTTVDRRTVL